MRSNDLAKCFTKCALPLSRQFQAGQAGGPNLLDNSTLGSVGLGVGGPAQSSGKVHKGINSDETSPDFCASSSPILGLGRRRDSAVALAGGGERFSVCPSGFLFSLVSQQVEWVWGSLLRLPSSCRDDFLSFGPGSPFFRGR